MCEQESKRKIPWDALAVFIAVLSLVVAGLIGYLSLNLSKQMMKSSDEATRQSLQNLSSLRTSFRETKLEMAKLPPSIRKLNKSFESLKKAADSQLAEYSKKPLLVLCISNLKIKKNNIKVEFGIKNVGNKSAKGLLIALLFPEKITILDTNGPIPKGIYSEDPDAFSSMSVDGHRLSNEFQGLYPMGATVNPGAYCNFNYPEATKVITVKYFISTEEYTGDGILDINLTTRQAIAKQGEWYSKIVFKDGEGQGSQVGRIAELKIKDLK